LRDNRLDVIRGFAILLLTVTHTFPGPVLLANSHHYYILTGFAFHGADVFVSFSGLVSGMVYARTIANDGFSVGMRRGFGRAVQLFIFNALAFIAVVLVVQTFRSSGVIAEHHSFDDPYAAALGTIFLYDPISYFNILNFYMILLVLLPIFVFLQSRSVLPIIVSATLYVAYQIMQFRANASPSGSAFFVSPIAWQFMFFGGVTVGMHYARIRDALPPLRKTIGAILLCFFATHFMRDQSWAVHHFMSKYNLGFLRIVDLILVFYVVDRMVEPSVKITAPIMQKISSIGSNSLFCFAMTLVLCYIGSNILVLFDGSRAAYLLVIVAEVMFMIGLGHLLLTRPGFRLMTQAKWIDRAIVGNPSGRSTST
jgi:hypothetical protein